jgi:formylglycine-generating enzyme required for sulfatase activity
MNRACLVLVMVATIAALVGGPGCGTKKQRIIFEKQGRVPQIGDRLRVDVLDERGNLACTDCSREFLVYTEDTWPVSFGVAPPEGGGRVRVRARLYRSLGGDLATNRHDLIDVTARLPDDYADDYEFLLPTLCFGQAPDVAAGTTCLINEASKLDYGPEPTLEPFGTSRLLPLSRPCEFEPLAGMVCVPGDVFIMGDSRLDAIAFDHPSKPEHAEWAPFPVHMDVDEMTVGTMRALVRKRSVLVDDKDERFALRVRGAPGSETDMCTYLGPDDATNDALPINCVGALLAFDACVALGKRLPYEYEWEFVAGNGSRETQYPWGDVAGERAIGQINEESRTICDNAIIGRGRISTRGESTRCRDFDVSLAPGPVAGGNPRDVTSHGIKNMAGNVAEWVADNFSLYAENCGTPCGKDSKILGGEPVPYRGGSWARSPDAAVTVARFAIERGAASSHVGFRCGFNEASVKE